MPVQTKTPIKKKQLILCIRNKINKRKRRKEIKIQLMWIELLQLYPAIIAIKRSQSRLYYLLYTCTWWMKWITGTTGQGGLISAALSYVCRNQWTTNLWSTTRLKIRRTQLYYKSSIMFYSSFTISSDVVHYVFLLFQWIVLNLDPDLWISKDI